MFLIFYAANWGYVSGRILSAPTRAVLFVQNIVCVSDLLIYTDIHLKLQFFGVCITLRPFRRERPMCRSGGNWLILHTICGESVSPVVIEGKERHTGRSLHSLPKDCSKNNNIPVDATGFVPIVGDGLCAVPFPRCSAVQFGGNKAAYSP